MDQSNQQEKEQRRLDAVHSAIVDAQQAALAEKLAKKRKSTVHLEVGPPISDRRSVSAVSPAPSQGQLALVIKIFKIYSSQRSLL